MSPWPSIGWPSGFTTRPRKASPTGTESTSPVRLTCWPCSIFSKSPRMTAPMLCSSRFSATPSTPPGNSRSSCVITEGRPSTWAMPSPASMTVPISSRSVSAENEDTYSSTAPSMSAAEIVNSAMLWSSYLLGCGWCGWGCSSVRQLRLGGRQPRCDGAIDHLVTDGDRESAEEFGIHVELDGHGMSVDPAQQLDEPVALVVTDFGCCADVRDD